MRTSQARIGSTRQAFGQDGEAERPFGSGDDLDLAAGGPGHPWAGVGLIGEDGFDPREEPSHGAKDPLGAVAVLDVGGVDHGDQQEAKRIDQDVTRAAPSPSWPRHSPKCRRFCVVFTD